MLNYPDAEVLTDEQRLKLIRLLFMAFVEIRDAGSKSDHSRATAVADALHNLAMHIAEGLPISRKRFHEDIASLRARFPDPKDTYNYAAALDALLAGHGPAPRA